MESTSAALPPPMPTKFWVTVKVCGVSGPGGRRERGLTKFTLRTENLSPWLKVSPAVQVIESKVPDWPPPLMVMAPAQVPAVCEYRFCSSKMSKVFSFPIEPSLKASVMASLGWKSEVTGVLMELVCIEEEINAARFLVKYEPAFCSSRARA